MENASNQTAADAGLATFAAIKTKAEQGDALAEFNLGTIYAEGGFVPQDYAAALMWFNKSAQNGNHEANCVLNGFRELWLRNALEHGDPRSQYYLCLIYENGYGVSRDYFEALKWCNNASDKGDADARSKLLASGQDGLEQSALMKTAQDQYALGKAYSREKDHFRKDETEALRRYNQAAQLGHAESQFILGAKYHKGQSVKRDLAEAAKWYRRAAEQGHAEAQNNLGDLLLKDRSPEAMQWYHKAVNQGWPIAHVNLGRCYAYGYFENERHVPRNCDEALKWFKKAEAYNDAAVQFSLGEIYANGWCGVETNIQEAINFYKKASQLGEFRAQLNLGWIYAKAGYLDTALDLWQKIGEQGKTVGLYYTGILYAKYKNDVPEAVIWHRKAAKRGHTPAKIKLGRIYFEGVGVEQDYPEAVAWSPAIQKLLGEKYQAAANYVEAYAWYNLKIPQRNRWAKECKKIALHMTSEEIKQAEKRTEELCMLVESKLHGITPTHSPCASA